MNNEFGERLKVLRGKKTLAEFAEPLLVSGSQISAIETGKSQMSIDLAKRICDLYGCTMDWLIRGIGTQDGTAPKVVEVQGDYVMVPKDELLGLYRKLNQQQEQEIVKLQKEAQKTKNIEVVSAGQ